MTDSMPPPAVLEFEGAAIGYEGHAVVDDLTVTVSAGEVVAVLGANGSGKSTIVRGLFGLAELHAGSVRVFGVDRDRFRAWRRVGYVPQSQTVAAGMPTTVREVVSSGRLAGLAPWRRFSDADRAAVAAAIESVGLTAVTRSPVAKLSGGQQRRVLIARALAGEPEVLVLDEPTAGVDAANQEALASILGSLHGHGLTIVLIAHELGPVAPLVSRVLVMRHGAVVFDGPPAAAPTGDGGDWHHPHGAPPLGGPGPGLLSGG